MEDIEKYLSELTHYDPHYRQNAVRFLSIRYIKEHDALSEDNKQLIIEGFLSRLETKEDSLEVKECTVRELGKIAYLLKTSEIVQIFKKLLSFISDNTCQGKDTYVNCANELLKKLEKSSCTTVGNIMLPYIYKGIGLKENNFYKNNSYIDFENQYKITPNNCETIEYCYETFTNYLNNFSSILITNDSIINNKEEIIYSVLVAIKYSSETLKKVCINFLGKFSIILKKSQMFSLIEHITDNIVKSKDLQLKINYVNALHSVVKSTGTKHKECFDKIYNIIKNYYNVDYIREFNMSDEYDLKNELAESCLSILELYILKLPNIISNNIVTIAENLVELVTYDPNYSYDNVETQSNNEASNYEEEYGDYYENYDYNVFSNDDSSWRVRRSSVRALHCFVKANIKIDKTTLNNIFNVLMLSIREHEENTKQDILICLSNYLKSLYIGIKNIDFNELDNNSKQEILVKTKSNLSEFNNIIINLNEIYNLELGKTSNNLKSSMLKIGVHLACINPSLFISNIKNLNIAFEECFKINNDCAILVVKQIYNSLKYIQDSFDIDSNNLNIIFELIHKGINHEDYKINIESIKLISEYIMFITNKSTNNSNHRYNYTDKISHSLYEILNPKLKIDDIDQEFKLVIIHCINNYVFYLGSYLNENELNSIFKILKEKSNNDNLRQIIYSVIINNLKVNPQTMFKITYAIEDIVENVINLLPNMNSKSQFQTLDFIYNIFLIEDLNKHLTKFNLINRFSKKLQDNLISLILLKEESIITSLYNIYYHMYLKFDISESDANNLLLATSKLFESNNVNNYGYNYDEIVFEVIKLVINKSSLINANDIYKLNCKFIEVEDNSNNLFNINKAKLISLLSIKLNIVKNTIDSCLNIINNKNKHFQASIKNSIMLLGELSLVYFKKDFNLFNIVFSLLKTIEDEYKQNIASCLGKISINNVDLLFDELSNTKNKNILSYCFIAVKECLSIFVKNISTSNNVNELSYDSLLKLYNHILTYSNNEEKYICQLLGESLALCALLSENILSLYFSNLNSDITSIACVCLYGLRYIFSSKRYNRNKLEPCFNTLLESISYNKPLIIKQNAYNSLPLFILNFSDYLKESNNNNKYNFLWENLSSSSNIDSSLIDTVDLGGGIKVKNDKGLTIRKHTYTSIKIIIENLKEKLNVNSCIKLLLNGLNDVEDIQSVSFTCLCKLCLISPETFVSIIDNIIEVLSNKINQLKSNVNNNANSDNSKFMFFIEETKKLINSLSDIYDINENTKFENFKFEVYNSFK